MQKQATVPNDSPKPPFCASNNMAFASEASFGCIPDTTFCSRRNVNCGKDQLQTKTSCDEFFAELGDPSQVHCLNTIKAKANQRAIANPNLQYPCTIKEQ